VADRDHGYGLQGYALRVSALVCLGSADYSLHPIAYWKLDFDEYGPWRSSVWGFAAFLAWCGSRYCFNRASVRPSSKLDRFLFGCAWIGIAGSILWILIGLMMLPSSLKDWE